MNIGIVTTWFERGAAYVSRQYMVSLQTQNNVFIYARAGEKYGKDDKNWNLENVTWGIKTDNRVRTHIDLNEFKKWLKKYNIEVVFFNEQVWWEPVLLCNSLSIKTGAYIDYYTEETIPFFGCYDFLICNTRRHFDTFCWHKQVYYIPWGTNVNLYKPQKTIPGNKDNITYFHSAGMNPFRKGSDLVIKAFSEICIDKSKLIVHTQKSLDKVFPDLGKIIKDLKDSGKLVCVEETIPMPGIYYMGDVYVYPSRLDGIGLTIIEALSCGLPVITCDNPPMNEFVNDDIGKLVKIDKLYSRFDGYYWPQCVPNYESLKLSMKWYIDNIEKLNTIKKKVREHALEYLDWNKNSVVLNEIFEKTKILDTKVDYIKSIRHFEETRMNLPPKFLIKKCKIYHILSAIKKRLSRLHLNWSFRVL